MNALNGLIDMHIHSAPDVRKRKLTDIEVAKAAKNAGMTAVVLKSHVTLTADRARIAESIVPGIRVFGGLTLNEQVGGINPSAVRSAIDMGAKVIWLPTTSSANHKEYHGELGGISLINRSGDLLPELLEIFKLIRNSKAVLATGHISMDEILRIVPIAKNEGLEKILITHPEVPWINMPIEKQKGLLEFGVMFERCYVSILKIGGGVPFSRISEAIKHVGIDTTILSTDFGADQLPAPVDGYLEYISALENQGFTDQQIINMGSINPARLLGLQDN